MSTRQATSAPPRLRARPRPTRLDAKRWASIAAALLLLLCAGCDKLGAKVAIQHTAKGKGKLVISYNSVDELDGILGRIK